MFLFKRIIFLVFIVVALGLSMCGTDSTGATVTPISSPENSTGALQPSTLTEDTETAEPSETKEEISPDLDRVETGSPAADPIPSPTLVPSEQIDENRDLEDVDVEIESEVEQNDRATISIQNLPQSVSLGERFEVEIIVSLSSGVSSDAAEVYLAYDPEILNVVSSNKGSQFEIELPVESSSGVFGYAAGTFSEAPVGISFNLISLELEAIGVGATVLEFVDPEGVPSTIVTSIGVDILDETIGGEMTVVPENGGEPQTTLLVFLAKVVNP